MPRRTRVVWALTALVLAGLAFVTPSIDNPYAVAAVLVASSPVNLLWNRILPTQYSEHTRPVFDGLVVVGLAAASASIWLPGFVAYAIGVGVSARERMPRVYALLHGFLLLGFAVVGLLHDVPYWFACIPTLVVLILVRGFSEPRWMDGVIADRFSLEQDQQRLQKQSMTDPVTGLANRRALLEQLARSLANPAQPTTGLLMMDLDRFKAINDTLGHAVGDRALRLVGERLAAASAPHRVCRLGGDEFAVVVENPGLIPNLVDAIARACEAPIEIGPLRLSIGVSMGSAVGPHDGSTASRLMRSGDLAMYHAKRHNLGHVNFGRELAAMSADEVHLSARVTQAIERDEFELWYQPKVDLGTGTIVGVEALARWRHPERGVLRPESFIGLVKVSQSQEAFTDAVIRSSAAMAAALSKVGYDIPVSINMPLYEFMRHDLVERLQAILKTHGLGPRQITIEVTEQTIMDDDRAVALTVRELAAAGFGLSIDDFGTGFSSFERLVDLPVRELKIDRRFVIAAVAHKKERAVVESIVDLAQRLNLDVVAEGVETTKERALMRRIGCTSAQGYHWCRPMPAAELIDLVVENAARFDPVG